MRYFSTRSNRENIPAAGGAPDKWFAPAWVCSLARCDSAAQECSMAVSTNIANPFPNSP